MRLNRIATLADLHRVGHVVRGEPDECWEWQGPRQAKGYGSWVRYEGRKRRPHVVALMLALGRELAPGMQANHSCDNPPCVNVSAGHVYEGTQAENMADRMRRTTCSRGHDMTPENTYWTPNGYRQCRACRRINDAKRRGTPIR
jgi:hypothetical protein